MSSKHSVLSWADRFALIDHFQPTDVQVCNVFGLSNDELETARELRQAGTFGVANMFDANKYGNPFTASASTGSTDRPTKAKPATIHTKPAGDDVKPETATKRAKVPQKRGRKGDKIQLALMAVPTTPVSVDDFRKQHGISLAVLRQSKRFISKMEKPVQEQIGEVKVRQDKDTKVLMIWREAK